MQQQHSELQHRSSAPETRLGLPTDEQSTVKVTSMRPSAAVPFCLVSCAVLCCASSPACETHSAVRIRRLSPRWRRCSPR